jgi:hypothetical protein
MSFRPKPMALIFLFVICVQTIGTLFNESIRRLAHSP